MSHSSWTAAALETLSLLETDCIFVSLDFENHQAFQSRFQDNNQKAQIGFCSFDTRDLKSTCCQLYTSQHTAGGGDYLRRTEGNFIFGTTRPLESSATKVQELCISRLQQPDLLAPRQLRKIVLVAHGLGDRRSLLDIGIDISKEQQIIRFFNTSQISCQQHFCPRKQIGSVKKLLEHFEIPHSRLHFAGNDANFTLKVLFAMTLRDFQEEKTTAAQQNILNKINQLVYQPMTAVHKYCWDWKIEGFVWQVPVRVRNAKGQAKNAAAHKRGRLKAMRKLCLAQKQRDLKAWKLLHAVSTDGNFGGIDDISRLLEGF